MSRGSDNPRDILLRPVISEKSYGLLDEGKYTFIVTPDANKTEVRLAVEEVFGVKVTGVNTVNRRGKRRRTRNGWGKRVDTKRAIVTLAAGGTLAVQGYSSLGNIGIEALTGFLAAFINVRISAPVVAGIGLAATFGAGVTAQLGAMRINEEIDALESMAIRPVEYLVSTRIVAGMIAITPLYSIAVILSFVASQFTTVVLFGQSGGLYDHYFNTFLNPIDLLWSFLQAVLMAVTILLVHTYFWFFASGGPSGVGVAVGNAVRTSLVVVVSVTLLVSLSIYGSNGNFNLSG